MVAISTAQSQINYIPFVKYRIDCLLLLQTADAIQKNWSQGLKKLSGGKFPCVTLDLTEDQEGDLLKLVERVRTELEKPRYAGAEIWINFGGGQKHHSIALWQVFVLRQNPGDMAVYADQTSGQIMRWYHNLDGLLLSDRTDQFEIGLPVEDILALYGKVQQKNPKKDRETRKFEPGAIFLKPEFKKRWRDDQIIQWLLEVSTTYSKEQEDLQFFASDGFTAEKRKEWVEKQMKLINRYSGILSHFLLSKVEHMPFNKNVVDQIRGLLTKQVKSLILYGEFDKDMRNAMGRQLAIPSEEPDVEEDVVVREIKKIRKSDFFEYLVQQIFQDRLTSLRGRHILCEAYSNLYVAPFQSAEAEVEAEYDLIFSTSRGRLYVIDAKTYDFKKKDADARLQVMQQAAGIYTRLIVVFPYFRMEPNYSLMRENLRRLPFELAKMKIPFYVLSEDDQEFTIYRQKGQIHVRMPEGKSDEEIRCIPFQSFFEKEGLLAAVPARSAGVAPGL